MTEEQYYETYKGTIWELLEKYAKDEGIRLSQIIREGNHHQINHYKYDIERLSTCRMLLEGRSLIKKG